MCLAFSCVCFVRGSFCFLFWSTEINWVTHITTGAYDTWVRVVNFVGNETPARHVFHTDKSGHYDVKKLPLFRNRKHEYIDIKAKPNVLKPTFDWTTTFLAWFIWNAVPECLHVNTNHRSWCCLMHFGLNGSVLNIFTCKMYESLNPQAGINHKDWLSGGQ